MVQQTRFTSAADLQVTLDHYAKTCNHLIPQRALQHLASVLALKDWHGRKPELLKGHVHDQPGLDI